MLVGNDAVVRQQTLEWLHASLQSGHYRVNATYKKIRGLFWWKRMHKNVQDFVGGCDTCARCKYEAAAAPWFLQPLTIPNKVWESIAMDFSEGIPKSHGKEVIWVVVDRMRKYAHFLALSSILNSYFKPVFYGSHL